MAYRIFISHSSDVAEVKQPLGKITISKEKSSNDYGGYYWETKMSSFTIQKKLDSAAYGVILGVENSIYRCDPMIVEVRNYTNIANNTYSLVYRGEFSANNCSFDLEKCLITVESNEQSLYRCIDKNADSDYNFLSGVNIIDATIIKKENYLPFSMVGDVEFTAVDMSADPTYDSLSIPGVIGGVAGTTTIYFRIYTITECIGGVSQTPSVGFGQDEDNWQALDECIALGDNTEYTKWVMYPPTYVGQYLVSQLTYSDTCPITTAVAQVTISGTCCSLVFLSGTPAIAVGTIPNGRALQDVVLDCLNFITTSCGNTFAFVKSDFFQWNSDLVDDGNSIITGSTHYWKNPVLFQISDVKFPSATEKASVGIITFKKLMSDLYKQFRVKWWIETDGSIYWIRIEHESQAESTSVYDLSGQSGFKKYSYSNDKLPFQIKYSTPVQRNIDFVGTEIVYQTGCTNQDVENVATEILCSDIDFIQAFPDDITNDAVVIVACDADANVWSSIGKISLNSQINAPMSWANLHDAFHRHGANTPEGTINNQSVVFSSTKRIKKQSIIAKNCNLNIHAYTMIETELGVGEISSISTDIATSVSNIDLLL